MKKKVQSRILALILAAVMLFPSAALAASNNKAVMESANGVVRVVTTYRVDYYRYPDQAYAGSGTGYSSGSGFGVGTAGKETDVFVTNRHVVTMEDQIIAENGVYYYAYYEITGFYILLDSYAYNTSSFTLDTSRSVPCTVIYVGQDEDEDVAVLRAAEPVSGRVALRLQDNEDSLEQTDSVYTIGYPGSSDHATSENYLLAGTSDVTVSTGNVSRFYDSASVTGANSGLITGHIIQHTASINHGNSGGPLVDQNGTVVGINTYLYVESSVTTFYSLRISYAKNALDSLGISYDVYKSGPSPVVIVVILVILVAAAAGVFLFLRQKGGMGPISVKAIPIKVGAASNAGQSSPAAQPAVPSAPLSAPLAPGDTGLRIQGQSGNFAGRRFAVNGTLRIGRDPANNDLVYPGNTPGISGRHCIVFLENGQLMLKDLGSTHGTFLSGGRRLGANQAVALSVGDQFWLGSEQEVFTVFRKEGV